MSNFVEDAEQFAGSSEGKTMISDAESQFGGGNSGSNNSNGDSANPAGGSLVQDGENFAKSSEGQTLEKDVESDL